MATPTTASDAPRAARVYLASASPRRRELLAQIGLVPEVLRVDLDETVQAGESAPLYVERLALAKARAGWAHPARAQDWPVLGADTSVILDGAILGKPANAGDCARMLERLSGRTHEVLTAVAIVQGTRAATRLSVSRVRFRATTAAERAAYCASGEPDDKAGGYAIQGLAALFVEHLDGSYSGVMGLPLCETAALLAQFGVDPLAR